MKPIIQDKIDLPNGETMHYRTCKGGQRILVMVHGQLASSLFFEDVMQALPEDYTVYAIDMRGFGGSSYNRPIDTLRDFASDLKLFADEMKLKTFDLLGWSTGGAVSMLFSACYGEMVSHLFLVASAGLSGYQTYATDSEGKVQFLDSKRAFQEDVSKKRQLEAVETKDKAFYRMLWKLIYNINVPDPVVFEAQIEESLSQKNLIDVYYCLAKFNISNSYNGFMMGSNEIRHLKMPTTIIQGDRDLLLSVETAKEIKEALGDHAKLILAENCGHSPMVDAHDILVKAIIER